MKEKATQILICIVVLLWFVLNIVQGWNNQPEEMTLKEQLRYERMIW